MRGEFSLLIDEIFAEVCERERRTTAACGELVKSLGGTQAARRARERRDLATRAELDRITAAATRMGKQGPPRPLPTAAERQASTRAGVQTVMCKALAAARAGHLTALQVGELEAHANLLLARAAAS